MVILYTLTSCMYGTVHWEVTLQLTSTLVRWCRPGTFPPFPVHDGGDAASVDRQPSQNLLARSPQPGENLLAGPAHQPRGCRQETTGRLIVCMRIVTHKLD